jgi:succinoglycan biosynthesis protein ExoW
MVSEPLRLAVVIPFYQRERGLLRRAVASILAQSLPENVALEIVIVDDDSPVPPIDEVAPLNIPPPYELRIVSQDNAGPGAARNRALDLLNPTATPYVAFLDSDDEWEAGHLGTAIAALNQGHDFYFCDHTRYQMKESWFEASPVLQSWREGTRNPIPVPLNGDEELFSLASQAAFDAFVEEYLSQTSTVVYRFDRHPALRFDTALRSAGEDYLFWLSLIRASGSVAFSTRKNVSCGRGVNIFFSAFDWDRPEAVARNGYMLVFRLKMRDLSLSADQAARINTLILEDSQTFAYLLVRNAVKGRVPDWNLLARIFRTSPLQALALPLRLLPMLSKSGRDRITAART